jgi:branched-chain amino acid aminotransferase
MIKTDAATAASSTAASASNGEQPLTRPSSKPLDPAARPYVWIDGELLPKADAKISVFDHGLLYGDGCFEGIRVYKGVIFKCQSHLDRIFRNAERLHMHRQGGDLQGNNGAGFPYTKDDIRRVMEECVAANDIYDGYIRLIFTRGYGDLGLHPFKCARPTVICIADTIRLYPEEMYQQGMKIIVAERPRTPAACLDPQLKSLNYLNNILAKVEAIDAGVLECIMLKYTDSGEQIVGECTGDNLFIIKDGELLTSPLDIPMLDGITRQFVLDTLAPDCGVSITERPLTLDEVMNADEVFLTGSAAEIIAVSQIGEKRISDGEGPVTRKLRSRFREIVTSDNIPVD